MIKVGIIGSTGYAGQEIVRILLGHKEAEIVWYGSRSFIDQKYYQVYGNMFQIVDAKCMDDNMEELASKVDVIFTATPQGLCGSLVNEEILSKVKIIDLSADFRIKDVATYEKWYKIEHKSPQFIDEAVYGLCEINREDIKKCRLLANPGCYTTCSILSLYPLVKEGLVDANSIIVDAKSGTSGAGRGAKIANLYCEVNESIKAYGVTTHRHTPEIEEQLGYANGSPIVINFTPHLVPMNRGILVTAYANLKEKVYAGTYYDMNIYEATAEGGESDSYCQIEVSNITDQTFDFAVYQLTDGNKQMILDTRTATFVEDGTKAVSEKDGTNLVFTFPDNWNALPKVVEMQVSGMDVLEGNSYVNNNVPGYEFG